MIYSLMIGNKLLAQETAWTGMKFKLVIIIYIVADYRFISTSNHMIPWSITD